MYQLTPLDTLNIRITMKYSVITLMVLLAGCASQAQLDEFERGMVNDIYCPGEVDESYSTTIYSSDNPEK